MSDYILSIVVYGPGTDTNHRSHWAFAIHRTSAESGVLLHVQLIDLARLIYQYDERSGVAIRSRSSEGSFAVAYLTKDQVGQAVKIIREEQAPKDGVEKCQDWVASNQVEDSDGETSDEASMVQKKRRQGRRVQDMREMMEEYPTRGRASSTNEAERGIERIRVVERMRAGTSEEESEGEEEYEEESEG